MPLTEKGRKILANMEKEYGPEKGKRVFYASENKGTIKGVAQHDKSKGTMRSHKSKVKQGKSKGY
jgi:hypothetical protein